MARRNRLPAVTVLLACVKGALNPKTETQRKIAVMDRTVEIFAYLSLFAQIQMTPEETRRVVTELSALQPQIDQFFSHSDHKERINKVVEIIIEELSLELPSY